MPALDSLYLRKSSYWPAFYAVMQRELGNTATLLDFGNQRTAGLVTATTWTGRKFHASGLSPVWTPSEALSAFDTPFDLKLESNWQGLAPKLTTNGTDEEADTPSVAYFSPGNGTADAAVSILAWVNIADTAAARWVLAKYDGAVAIQEWQFGINANDALLFLVRDDSAAVEANRLSNAVVPLGNVILIGVTYDGTGGATAMNGATLYVNGASVASTANNDANYVAMEAGTSVVTLGFGNGSNFLTDFILGGPWAPAYVQAALTAAQHANIFQEMRLGLGV